MLKYGWVEAVDCLCGGITPLPAYDDDGPVLEATAEDVDAELREDEELGDMDLSDHFPLHVAYCDETRAMYMVCADGVTLGDHLRLEGSR